MVSYIFSDKTGTLTQNVMEFKKFSAGHFSYGETHPDLNRQEYDKGVTNVNFYDADFYNEWPNATTDNYDNIVDFINILAICHTIIVEVKDGVPIYNASSPDELALTNAARHFGLVFENRDENSNVIVYNKHTK
jgi:magnesium-transporting ATPase (P-type)